MQCTVIHDSPRFSLTSWGNGTAYELASKSAGKSVFFQGGDATEFWGEYEGLTQADGLALNDDDALACIWGDYQEIAQ